MAVIFSDVQMLRLRRRLASKANSQMENFRNAIFDANLNDMGFVGNKFTWSMEKDDGSCVREKLDRVLVATSWKDLFPNAVVMHGGYNFSDHRQLEIRFVFGYKKEKEKKYTH